MVGATVGFMYGHDLRFHASPARSLQVVARASSKLHVQGSETKYGPCILITVSMLSERRVTMRRNEVSCWTFGALAVCTPYAHAPPGNSYIGAPVSFLHRWYVGVVCFELASPRLWVIKRSLGRSLDMNDQAVVGRLRAAA